MIRVLPYFSETIVTSLQIEEVTALFQHVTAESVQWDQEFKLPEGKLFYGYVYKNHFQLAARNMRLFSFNPLVLGNIESTKNGSIIFLRYQLFVITRMMLIFWTIFLGIAGVISFVYLENFLSAAGILLLLVLIHLVVRANFNLQVKPTKQAIFDLLAR